jgi:hypothetical protein
MSNPGQQTMKQYSEGKTTYFEFPNVETFDYWFEQLRKEIPEIDAAAKFSSDVTALGVKFKFDRANLKAEMEIPHVPESITSLSNKSSGGKRKRRGRRKQGRFWMQR